jgi:hypothetical protein
MQPVVVSASVAELALYYIVAVDENVSFDDDGISDDALDRKTAAVYLW